MEQINNILKKMYDYQQEHNITEECLTNSQYLFQYIKNNKLGKCSVKAVIVVINVDRFTQIVCVNHFVVEMDKQIIEPSYEYKKYSNATYYKNYNEFIDTEYGLLYRGEYSKIKHVNSFCRFVKLEIEINIYHKIKRVNEAYYEILNNL
jgi:hypothetical protein